MKDESEGFDKECRQPRPGSKQSIPNMGGGEIDQEAGQSSKGKLSNMDEVYFDWSNW